MFVLFCKMLSNSYFLSLIKVLSILFYFPALENQALMWKQQTTNSRTLETRNSLCLLQPASHLQKVCKPTDSIFIVCAFQLRLSEFHQSFTSLRCSDNCSRTITVCSADVAAQFPSAMPLTQCLTFDPWMFPSIWLNIVVSSDLNSFQASLASRLLNMSCTDMDVKWTVDKLNADKSVHSFLSLIHWCFSSVV